MIKVKVPEDWWTTRVGLATLFFIALISLAVGHLMGAGL